MELAIEISPERIRLGASARDWRAAIRLAGRLLMVHGAVSAEYVLAMEQVIDEAGPYCVVAPGLALPHARPGSWVSSCSVGVLVLRSPVTFGCRSNDPVDVLIPFATKDCTSHIRALAELSRMFSVPASLRTIRLARHEVEVARFFGAHPAAGGGGVWS
jgi:PTS system ascorbate-specific IIA component